MKKVWLSFVAVCLLSLGLSQATFAATRTYTVKSGDSLYKIARKYHVTVAQLKSWNHLRSNLIRVHQKLKLQSSSKNVKTSSSSSAYRTITVKATAYTANSGSGITATGINLRKHPAAKVIAVDPKVIRLGSKVYVPGYGTAVAGDTGGAVKGKKIDVFISSKKKAINWGVKIVKIKVYK
ncbi:3D domain-containing protein [Heyndrickxia acidiproducens]|uniref:3D domain-containing protein n=1 Tax=Heyndrickxia acidiproducens TaxID=1121084 RepID=UPI0003657154|nr:3D domain-containing protein [Heyndrickxia acidiproducens]